MFSDEKMTEVLAGLREGWTGPKKRNVNNEVVILTRWL